MNMERAEALSASTLDDLFADSLLDTSADAEIPSRYWLEVWILGDDKVPSIAEGFDDLAEALGSSHRWWDAAHVRRVRLVDELDESTCCDWGREPDPATLVILPQDRAHGYRSWRECLRSARSLMAQGYRPEDLALYRRGRRIWAAS